MRIKELLIIAIALFTFVSCSEDPEVIPKDDTEQQDTDDDTENDDPNTDDPDIEDSTSFDSLFADENDSILYSTNYSFIRTIYVDSELGSDSNNGLSTSSPIKSLTQLATMRITSGDQILLKGGIEHKGTIDIISQNPATEIPIHIGSYGDSKARLNAQGECAGVFIYNSSYVTVSDIKITADGYPVGGDPEPSDRGYNTANTNCNKIGDGGRYGVLLYNYAEVTTSNTIFNVDIKDIFYFYENDPLMTTLLASNPRPCRVWDTSGEDYYGWGIRSYAHAADSENLKIEQCNIYNTSHTGIKVNANSTYRHRDATITKTNIFDAGGPGAQFGKANNCVMDYCKTVRPGSSSNEDGAQDNRKWGRGSGMWCHTCDGFLFDHNHYERSEGIGDCCGAHIDIGNTNIMIQNCLSLDNCGGFIEVLGKNSNCCYRFNVSIDDGWRNPSYDDTLQWAFWNWDYTYNASTDSYNAVGSDGCIFTINGHDGDENNAPLYNTYIYNNTIITNSPRMDGFINPYIFEISQCASAVLFANNILYTPEQMAKVSWTDHLTKDDSDIGGVAYDYRYYVYKAGVADGTPIITSGSDKNIELIPCSYDDMVELEHRITNNIYKLYDPAYPFAENALPPVEKQDEDFTYPEEGDDDYYARYIDWDIESKQPTALGGDPMFANIAGTTIEDFVPQNSTLVNQGIEIKKLTHDTTPYGVSYNSSDKGIGVTLNPTVDILGNPISGNIIGALAPR